MLEIISSGIQTTLQGAPRAGLRHGGVPWAGPVDPWSMALANKLVGNVPDATALEITFGGFACRFSTKIWFALSGASAEATLDGKPISFHRTTLAPSGSLLDVQHAKAGMRIYLAAAGRVESDEFLGSASTYLPAQFGGVDGRSLQAGDELVIARQPQRLEPLFTPERFQPAISRTYTIRAVDSAETHLLAPTSRDRLFGAEFEIGHQPTRMGVTLVGETLELKSDGKMKSAAVFPGIIQCPENGAPIVLLADAQTTGGYPRVASIMRGDLHIIGQVRPGDRVRLLHRTMEQAIKETAAKQELLRGWIPDFNF